MDEIPTIPKVSIGMPVFNGEQFIRKALDSVLEQSFSDFELIISDNASTDATEYICRGYAARDQRIRYVRQSTNLGAAANFKFVFGDARGEYFMWAACDDTRSPDFIELNVKYLSENQEYVASTSPSGFDDQSLNKQNLADFALDDGEIFDRFIKFFDNCWVSNGLFYSLMRSEVLRSCEIIGQSFIGFDWAIILYLASKGKVNRTTGGYAIFGAKGVSRSSSAYKAFRNNVAELFIPFYRLTQYVIKLSGSLPPRQRAVIIFVLAKLNISAAFDPFRRALYPVLRPIYRTIFKPRVGR